ncbi:MAG TPA: hypothetical protein VJ547_11700 [Candidatus Thermoplasmatota archaeon]|nr:hypothetical protein [Candidatus Thermoplasmatota archaeon]
MPRNPTTSGNHRPSWGKSLAPIVALAMLTLSLVFPYYEESTNETLLESHRTYTLFGAHGELSPPGGGPDYIPLSEAMSQPAPAIPPVLRITLTFVLGSLSALALAITGPPHLSAGTREKLVLASAVLALAGSLVFAMAFGIAWGRDLTSPEIGGPGPSSSFFGFLGTDYGLTYSWGPGPGWFLLVGSGTVMAVGFALAVKRRGTLAPPSPRKPPAK